MPVDDRTRLNLHRKLEVVLGPEEAATLMAHLPPVTWNDVATKEFVEHEIAVLRAEMHTGFADLRTAIADAITGQTKWLVTFVAAWSALLLTAARLIP
jgi:hypothetical protein